MQRPSRDNSRAARAGAPDRRPHVRAAICTAVVAALSLAGGAQAKSHLWDTLVVFSNAAGNVQFIDMFVSDPAGTGEYFLNGFTLKSNSNTYVFPHSLPMDHSTYLTWVLIATQDYADLPGAPTPDYIIPPNFFDPAGDEIRYRDTIDIFTIPPGAMPTDGLHALARDLSTPVNVGINFAGESGTVNLPPPIPTLPGWGLGLAAALLGIVCALALRGHRSTPRAA